MVQQAALAHLAAQQRQRRSASISLRSAPGAGDVAVVPQSPQLAQHQPNVGPSLGGSAPTRTAQANKLTSSNGKAYVAGKLSGPSPAQQHSLRNRQVLQPLSNQAVPEQQQAYRHVSASSRGAQQQQVSMVRKPLFEPTPVGAKGISRVKPSAGLPSYAAGQAGAEVDQQPEILELTLKGSMLQPQDLQAGSSHLAGVSGGSVQLHQTLELRPYGTAQLSAAGQPEVDKPSSTVSTTPMGRSQGAAASGPAALTVTTAEPASTAGGALRFVPAPVTTTSGFSSQPPAQSPWAQAKSSQWLPVAPVGLAAQLASSPAPASAIAASASVQILPALPAALAGPAALSTTAAGAPATVAGAAVQPVTTFHASTGLVLPLNLAARPAQNMQTAQLAHGGVAASGASEPSAASSVPSAAVLPGGGTGSAAPALVPAAMSTPVRNVLRVAFGPDHRQSMLYMGPPLKLLAAEAAAAGARCARLLMHRMTLCMVTCFRVASSPSCITATIPGTRPPRLTCLRHASPLHPPHCKRQWGHGQSTCGPG